MLRASSDCLVCVGHLPFDTRTGQSGEHGLRLLEGNPEAPYPDAPSAHRVGLIHSTSVPPLAFPALEMPKSKAAEAS